MRVKTWKKTQGFYSKLFVLISFSLSQYTCNEENEKGEYQHTIEVCDDVNVEVYRTFGSGALGSDRVSNYITDSVNFRVFVDNFENYDRRFKYECIKDTLYVYSLYKSDIDTVFREIKTNTYSLSKLRKLNNLSNLETVKIDEIK